MEGLMRQFTKEDWMDEAIKSFENGSEWAMWLFLFWWADA
jgi:hypothetical protein